MQGFYDGIIKWYSEEKGYGFITHDQKDFFVHASGIINDGSPSLKSGESVEFTLIASDKGPKAINVKRKPLISNKGAYNYENNNTQNV